MKTLAPVPFTFDLELKAADGNVVQELQDGDLLIEGWGATLDVDREEEAFTDNAFTKGLKKFLSGSAPLCWHHQYDKVIGRVVDAQVVPGRGVWLKAVVDHQPETSPLFPVYQAIKRGRANGLSCGGIFKRIQTNLGPRINHVDLMEWSATATPVGPSAQFSVIAGKALEYKAEGADADNEEHNPDRGVEPPPPKTDKDEQETGTVSEPAPEREEEEEAQREAAEREAAEREAAAAAEIEPVELADGAVTAEKIANGSIKTEHLSDELRSRFSELKEEEGPTLEQLAAALDSFNASLDKVAAHVGLVTESESGPQPVNSLASVSSRQ